MFSYTSWPHLWYCQTPSAFPPLFLQSCPREPTGRTSPPRTLAADAPPHLSRSPWSCLLASPWFWLGFALSKNKRIKIKKCIDIVKQNGEGNVCQHSSYGPTFRLLSLRCWTNFIRSAGSVMILKLNFSAKQRRSVKELQWGILTILIITEVQISSTYQKCYISFHCCLRLFKWSNQTEGH